MLSADALVLCAGTLPQASLTEKISVAAAAGFSAISLFHSDYSAARAEGHSDVDLRQMLADHGLEIAELDPLLNWVPGAELGGGANDQGAAFYQTTEAEFHSLAAALGGRSINLALATDKELSRDEIAAAFAGVCDRAAERGLQVHLEFLPWTPIGNLAAALDIVERAGRPNGGVMLDSWHHFRSGTPNAELLTVPGARINAVQLSDAPQQPGHDLVAETLTRRRVPGDGDIDLVELLLYLQQIGCTAPIGVEIFSEELAKRPALEVAQRAADAVRSLLQRARARGASAAVAPLTSETQGES